MYEVEHNSHINKTMTAGMEKLRELITEKMPWVDTREWDMQNFKHMAEQLITDEYERKGAI